MYNEGSLGSKICIIGEAPGESEERTGRPFVGMAGELLNTMLRSAGITRQECYITNVLKERPPKNDISSFISIKGDRATVSSRYIDHEKALYAELAQCKANIFIPMGNVPLYALTRLGRITKRRGSILPAGLHCGAGVAGRKVIPTIHPSACLHMGFTGGMYIYRYFILHDLVLSRSERESPEINLLKREYTLDPSFEQSIEYITSCNKLGTVGFDIEVVGREFLSCFSLAKSASDAISIPLVKGGDSRFTAEEELAILTALSDLLSNVQVVKVGQNIVFDATSMYLKYGIITRNVADTMIAHGVVYPDFPKGLDMIASLHTDIAYYKDEGKKWTMKGMGEEKSFWLYNAKDSIVCMDAYPKIMEDAYTQGVAEVIERHTKLIPILVYMHQRGIKMDMDNMVAQNKQIEADINITQFELDNIVGHCVNVNSPKQLRDLFYDELGYDSYTKKGKITTDETAMKRLARKGVRAASLVQDIRRLVKLRSTYINPDKVDKDGRWRCSFNPIGTKNGRLSSSETIMDTGGNMQNFPDIAKRLMVVDEGMLFFEVDLSQAENRIVAYTAPEPLMIRAFERGIDIHAQTGALISGIPIKEVIEQDELEIPCTLGAGDKTWRFWGKKANHGLNYGEGYRKFSLINEIPEIDGKMIVERYHSIYPGIRLGHDWIRSQLSLNRTLTNCLGRKRKFMDAWGTDLFNEAYNFIPQSTVADIINTVLINIWEHHQLTDIDFINQIHDSIVFQLPVRIGWSTISLYINIIKAMMEMKISWRGQDFVIPVDVKIGLNLGKYKVKENPTGMTKLDLKSPSLPLAIRSAYEMLTTENGGSEHGLD